MSVHLRLAAAEDAARLNAALAGLSRDLGDDHAAEVGALVHAGWGPAPAFRAQIAETGPGPLAGATLYSPVFSTVRGGAGIYVSDLWASPALRGQGLGRRLLVAALADGAETWGAGFIKLAAYHASVDALRFYDRLGFRVIEGQHDLVLDAEGCAALGGTE